jgi:hypothetical protein
MDCNIGPPLHIPFQAERHYSPPFLRDNFLSLARWSDRLYADCESGGCIWEIIDGACAYPQYSNTTATWTPATNHTATSLTIPFDITSTHVTEIVATLLENGTPIGSWKVKKPGGVVPLTTPLTLIAGRAYSWSYNYGTSTPTVAVVWKYSKVYLNPDAGSMHGYVAADLANQIVGWDNGISTTTLNIPIDRPVVHNQTARWHYGIGGRGTIGFQWKFNGFAVQSTGVAIRTITFAGGTDTVVNVDPAGESSTIEIPSNVVASVSGGHDLNRNPSLTRNFSITVVAPSWTVNHLRPRMVLTGDCGVVTRAWNCP